MRVKKKGSRASLWQGAFVVGARAAPASYLLSVNAPRVYSGPERRQARFRAVAGTP